MGSLPPRTHGPINDHESTRPMRLLLDTHVFLWWITDDERLSPRARALIADGNNELFLSAASAWEIVAKLRLGRVTLAGDPSSIIPEQLALNGIHSLPIQAVHALRLSALPPHHRDPFDRLLIAQAQAENLTVLTTDGRFAAYGIATTW